MPHKPSPPLDLPAMDPYGYPREEKPEMHIRNALTLLLYAKVDVRGYERHFVLSEEQHRAVLNRLRAAIAHLENRVL